jgi:membrane protease YdiL (CAAX protease family)
MKFLKNMSPFLFAFAMLFAIGLFMFIPTESLFENKNISKFEFEYINIFIKMSLLFILCYIIIIKLKLKTIAGLSSKYKWKFKYLNLIPIYLFIIGLLTVASKDVSQIQLSNLLILLFGCLAVGFGEEFIFRGLLQPLFLKKYIKHRRGMLLGVFIPALFFGLFHLVNLIDSQQVLPVLIQVVFATFIGFFFGVLVLKTNKLVPLAITHGLINFFLSLQTLPGLNDASVNNVSQEGIGAALGPIILFFPLFITGLIIIIKMNKENTQEKLQASFN